MSATVNIAELSSELQAQVVSQLAASEDPAGERDILSSSQAREERAQRLATDFVKFINDHIPLLIQVRQDFLDKQPDETICGVRTFTEYCGGVLHYSLRHVQRLIAGKVPEVKKFDGSANRSTDPNANPTDCPHCGERFPSRKKYSKHFAETHPDVVSRNGFTCSVCQETFQTINDVRAHRASAHTQAPAAAATEHTENPEPEIEPEPAEDDDVEPEPPSPADILKDRQRKLKAVAAELENLPEPNADHVSKLKAVRALLKKANDLLDSIPSTESLAEYQLLADIYDERKRLGSRIGEVAEHTEGLNRLIAECLYIRRGDDTLPPDEFDLRWSYDTLPNLGHDAHAINRQFKALAARDGWLFTKSGFVKVA